MALHLPRESMPTPAGYLIPSRRSRLEEPFVLPLNHGSKDTRAYPMSRRMPTLTSIDSWSL
jgi:hypothetical protein